MARVLIVIAGGIAAYKVLEVIRRLRERGHETPVVLTEAGARFVTPLSIGALSNAPVLTDLFDLDREREIGHIRLARSADLVLVAPPPPTSSPAWRRAARTTLRRRRCSRPAPPSSPRPR